MKRLRLPRWLRNIGILTIGLVLLAVGLILLAPYAGSWWVRSHISADQQTLVDDYMNLPLRLPDDWRKPQPFSPELTAAAGALLTAYAPRRDDLVPREMRGLVTRLAEDSPSAEDWTSATELVRHEAQILSAALHLASIPDYDIEVFSRPFDDFNRNTFGAVGWGSGLIALEAMTLSRADAGALDLATTRALSALRLGQRHPANVVLLHLIAIVAQQNGISAMTAILRSDPSEALLTAAAEEIERMVPKLSPGVGRNPNYSEFIGQLRAYDRDGFAVHIPTNEPAGHYGALFVDTSSAHRRWQLAHLPASDPRRAAIEKKIRETPAIFRHRGTTLLQLQQSSFWGRRLSKTMQEWLYIMAVPNMARFDTHEREVESDLNLLRLSIAARRFEYAHGKPSTGQSDLIPKYLTAELSDPTSGLPYRWNSELGAFEQVPVKDTPAGGAE